MFVEDSENFHCEGDFAAYISYLGENFHLLVESHFSLQQPLPRQSLLGSLENLFPESA